MLTVKDLNVKGTRVIVRVDFNVPLKGGEIRDDNRIQAALPTIKELINKGARVILMSHLGKVKHKLAQEDPEQFAKQIKDGNMAPVAKRLSELLGQEVVFVPATRGEELEKAALKAWEETKKAREKEEKERKRNRKPKQPTYNAKSSLIKIPNDFYYDKELGSEALIKAAINEFNKYGYDGGLFTTKQIKDLFKDTHDENFAIIEFDGNSRGYEKADKAIESLFKKGSWIDYTPEYEQQGLDDDNSVLMKFNSTDGRKIYVLDSGDWGISWTCVQL